MASDRAHNINFQKLFSGVPGVGPNQFSTIFFMFVPIVLCFGLKTMEMQSTFMWAMPNKCHLAGLQMAFIWLSPRESRLYFHSF